MFLRRISVSRSWLMLPSISPYTDISPAVGPSSPPIIFSSGVFHLHPIANAVALAHFLGHLQSAGRVEHHQLLEDMLGLICLPARIRSSIAILLSPVPSPLAPMPAHGLAAGLAIANGHHTL